MKRLLPHLIGMASVLMVNAMLASAGENVVLTNGFRLHADRHEVDGNTVRVFASSGVLEMPAASIAGYEEEEWVAPVIHNGAPVVARAAELKPTIFSSTPADLANQAAKKYQLPDSFVRSVMKAESGFEVNAISPKGAIGLMQLMPETARALGADPRDPHQNADAGAQYLRELLARYENDPDQVLLALAAYNAGPGAVDHYHGVPPYRETREYILRVLKNWQETGIK